MSSQSNKAAWISEKGKPIEVGDAPVGKPGPGQLLVQNHAVAINPIDWKMQDRGYYVQKWPTILGCDLAGEVAEVGEGVTHFKKGDRVLAHPFGPVNSNLTECSFQNFTVVNASVTAKIPAEMSFGTASVLPLSLSTAAAGLFDPKALGLPYPTANPKKSNRTLLVWGGSSSVGSSAIQLAVAAGVDVITTASKKNFDYCKNLGARAVFDHTNLGIVGDLTEELQKGEIVGAYDSIGTRDTTMACGQVLAQLGGGYIASVLQPPEDLPATVNSVQVFAPNVGMRSPEIGKAVYGDFLPGALASGQLKPLPEAMVTGSGIESIQAAITKNKKGVSATKIVVTL